MPFWYDPSAAGNKRISNVLSKVSLTMPAKPIKTIGQAYLSIFLYKLKSNLRRILMTKGHNKRKETILAIALAARTKVT